MRKADTPEQKARKAEYMREYYLRNKERIQQYQKEYQIKHQDRLRAYHRANWKKRRMEISERRNKQYREKTLYKWDNAKQSEQS